jgi:hypothetical protein
LREAAGRIGGAIAEAGKGTANVVPIPKGAAVTWRIKEFSLEDMLLAWLHAAKNALRRRDLDEIEDFFEYVTRFPREQWPAEVARFVDRYKRPAECAQGESWRTVLPPIRTASRQHTPPVSSNTGAMIGLATIQSGTCPTR